jgi:hypothetical protein
MEQDVIRVLGLIVIAAALVGCGLAAQRAQQENFMSVSQQTKEMTEQCQSQFFRSGT